MQMKREILVTAAGMTALSLWAAPSVRDGSVRLYQDDARKLVVEYEITGEPAIVTAAFSEGGTAINGCLTADAWGDINRKVGVGTHRFYLDPAGIAADREVSAGNLGVTLSAWATNCPPDYLVVDLCYTNIVKFYANTNSFPGGFGSDRYKTKELVMRRIPAAGIEWRMGNPSWVVDHGGIANNPNHYVTLSSDYYIGVYELTEAQYWNISAGREDTAHVGRVPKGSLSYDALRGTDFSWPGDGHRVAASSVLGKARGLTGLELDLPVDAQWEYACRAGKQGILSFEYDWNMDDGHPGQFHGDSWQVGANSDPYAWYTRNSGNAAHEVGLLKPNAFGLYDMHGNVGEWTLDWHSTLTTDAVTDPEGPASGTSRIIRGGYYNDSCSSGESGSRIAYTPATGYSNFGCRLACPIGQW